MVGWVFVRLCVGIELEKGVWLGGNYIILIER